VHAATVVLGIMLIAHLNLSSRAAYEELFRLQRGTPQDVAFLRSLRGEVFSRFVFIPVENVAFNGWFSGPVFEYYSDRSVSVFDGKTQLASGDKVLVLAHERQQFLMADLSGYLHVVFSNENCGARFCAYDVGKP